MNKRIAIISTLILVVFSFALGYVIINNNYNLLTPEDIQNDSKISIYVEDGEATNNYVQNNNFDWTQGDYYLNTEMSNCTNNASVSWDNANKAVSLSTNETDHCELYFTIAVNMNVNSANVNTSYDAQAHSLNITTDKPGAKVYYSSTELNSQNYQNGQLTSPSYTNAGTYTVYWCAVYSSAIQCGHNQIIINKAPSTLTLNSNNIKVSSTDTVTYNYNGDGTVSCTPIKGSYGTCSVNQSTKTITVTKTATGTQNYTISATSGTNYLAPSNVTLTVVFCFTEDTEVEEWDRKNKKKRKKKIKDIKVGDIVYAYDYITDQLVTRRVEKIHIAKTNEICHIFVNGEDIKTTRDHPFYVKDVGFFEASLLKPGYKLAAGNGTYYEVERIEFESLDHPVDMYCFELEDGSSFIVGSLGIAAKTIYAVSLGILGVSFNVHMVKASDAYA